MSDINRIVAMVLIALVGTACGAGQELAGPSSTATVNSTTSSTVAPTTTTSTTSTTAAPSTTTTAPVAEARSLSEVEGGTPSGVGWLAEPGLYEATVGQYTIRIDMPEAFTYIPTPGRALVLAPAGIPDNGWQVNLIALTPFVGVIPADQIGIHQPHDPIVPEIAEPIPQDLSTWLESIAQMTVEAAGATDGDGFTASSWNIIVDPESGPTFPCDYGQCLGVLAQEDSGVWVMGDEFGFRLWQFDGVGAGLIGFGQAPLEDLDGADGFYEMVMGGLSFGG